MSTHRRRSRFFDTGAFYARFNPRDENHDSSVAVFGRIRDGELVYGPLYTSHFILSELATLLGRHSSHERAVEAMDSIVDSASSFERRSVGNETFHRAYNQFRQFDDREISFVDHPSGVLATGRDVGHVSTYDTTDFRTLGFHCVPDDVSGTDP